MRLAERDVALVLSAEGHQVMQVSVVDVPQESAFAVRIEDIDDIGLWVRVPRADGDHPVGAVGIHLVHRFSHWRSEAKDGHKNVSREF